MVSIMNKKQRKTHCLAIAASGGKASAKKLTKKQRSEKARKAAQHRWFKPSDVVI